MTNNVEPEQNMNVQVDLCHKVFFSVENVSPLFIIISFDVTPTCKSVSEHCLL